MTETKKSWNPLGVVLVLSAAFFSLFLVVAAAVLIASSGGKGERGALFKKPAVAVVEVNGVILDSKKILQRLEKLEDDDNVKAIVVRLNSPGGAVGPSQEIYEAIKAFKKPVVASMGSVAASGAYYIACGAKKVYANAGTITGSIGVIMEFANLEKLYEWAKIQRYVIKTGKFKDAGAEYRSMDPEERQLLQAMVDDVLTQFKLAVVGGRKMSPESVDQIADGRIFSGQQAQKLRLVDQIGTIKDAIKDAAELGGIKDKPRVVYPDKPRRKWWDLLMDNADRESGESSEAEVQDTLAVRLREVMFGAVLGDVAPSTVRPAGIYWLWKGGN